MRLSNATAPHAKEPTRLRFRILFTKTICLHLLQNGVLKIFSKICGFQKAKQRYEMCRKIRKDTLPWDKVCFCVLIFIFICVFV
jgi:hypothetical protein